MFKLYFKKILFVAAILLIAASIPFSAKVGSKPEREAAPLAYNYKLTEDSKEKLYNDILVSLLSPYTQKAVDDFYGKYLKELPGADPNWDRVLSVERVGGENRLQYLITLETMPYIGPHNSAGRDHITFRVRALGEVTLEKFEHVESSSVFPQLYPDIIKKWPPQ